MNRATRTRRISPQTGARVLGLPLHLPGRVVVEASKRVGALAKTRFAARVRRPAFIVGCARSGTTMLNYLFDLHPEVANFPTEANDLWHPRAYPWREATLEVPPFWVDPRRFTELSLADRRPEDDIRLKATFGAFQALSRRPVFLNKTVTVTFMLAKVVDLFPEARFVHLIRDGRAVALSLLEKERDKLTHPRYAARGYRFDEPTLLEIYARLWQAHILELDDAARRLGLRESGRWHDMRYEALCADAVPHMAALAAFLGISEEPFLRADLSHLRNYNDKARARLTGDRMAALNQAAAQALALTGYGRAIA